ncbi:bifunctional protein-disulfide isomerase/oxidoreductase DsbC [Zophobihabitans entericus]|uniref:Thiol:disulfide interchange protein n=1 Tax=Zophobihabitans entericus TaxID=1635327 RepID=A0A6G9IA05_9GAMM|nr:bifunctional protein-disulfide isomerase/oxidoreductase DsbC [Zophobihabitans entericus]QIQ20410.1 bifunctional protein-disulfide isomerase/oxidoreductase DsbC [Zophobihabitans entericus]
MKKIIVSLGLIGSLVAGNALANDKDILNTLNNLGVQSNGVKITSSPISGLKTVLTPQGIFYVSDDGKYVSQGPIYNVQNGNPENIANSIIADLVKSVIKDAIVYKAANEKYVITVFTDITCSYCKKLHDEADEYNKLGITIRYLAYPRQGLDNQVAKDMQSIWSSSDRRAALDNAYKGGRVVAANSMVPYVANHYQIGRQIGITGTPAIVLADGQLVSGYVPPAELKTMLDRRFGN